MKRIISIVLAMALMLSIAVVSVNAVDVSEFTAGERALLMMQRADVNGDGQYSTDDVSVVLKAAAGIIQVENEEYYDIDLDGYVSVRDAQLMLEVVSGVGSIVSDEDTLEAFNTLINGVKTKKPGFNKSTTVVCPTIKVTSSGYTFPLTSLNVTNMDFDDYINKSADLIEKFDANGQFAADVADMRQSAIDVYKPQTENKTVAASSNSHYTYFPVNNLGWSSKLTMADIKSIDYAVDGGVMVYTITMNDYTYTGSQYPTGTKGFSDRQNLPYGKIFNLPALDDDESSTINSVKLQKGKVILKADLLTGNVISVDYSYVYISDITVVTEEENSTITMRTVTTTNVGESFDLNH